MAKSTIGPVTNIPLSPATVANGFVFISGRVPVAPDGAVPEGIDAQTRVVMDQIKSLVELAGSTMDSVVKTTVFITQKEDF
ncbi:MAG: RidA family protein, partial [Pseudomonadota bacterium]